MFAGAEFGLLGPLTVAAGGRAVPVGGQRDQRVLAGLLLHDGRPVEIDALVGYAWDDPPPTARQQIYTVVYRLRMRLGGRLRSGDAGYRIDLDGCRLDAADFAAGVRQGRALIAEGHLDEGVRELRAALRLWRGRALAGVPGQRIAVHATRLEEERLVALEECAEAELRLGRHRQLIPELQALAAEHPLREGFATLLMTGLARDGRQADAIGAYQRVVATLRDELGVEPGRRLREAYLETLRGTEGAAPPALATGVAGPGGAPAAPALAGPGRLPRAPRRLVGRDAELSRLVDGARAERQRPHVVVVDGMAGVGKSALALTAAHALAADFAAAQLYLDLGGQGEGDRVAPSDALGGLLRRLGEVPPGGEAERVELWAQLMRERRCVVVLDNAAGAAQVEPLLPAESPSVVLVTSRRRLAPIDGAVALSLEPLAPAAAVELLRDTADERIDADPEAAAVVAGLCGGLPLALRLVGHRLRHRPRWTVEMLAEQLASAAHEALRISAEGRSTAAAFEVSYRQLAEPERRVFRLLGLHPGGTFEAEAAAALAGVPVAGARDVLDNLVEANLVQADVPGRYRVHDLLHAYAGTLPAAGESEPAVQRMLSYYEATLELADRHLHLLEAEFDPLPAATAEPIPVRAFATTSECVAWVTEHWACITALVDLAERAGEHRHTAVLCRVALPAARVTGIIAESGSMMDKGLAAAEALGDDAVTADVTRLCGGLLLRLGRYADSRACLQRSADARRRLGDESGARLSEALLSIVLRHEGRLAESLAQAERVAAEAQAAGAPRVRLLVLAEAGLVLQMLGRPERARQVLREVLARRDIYERPHGGIALGYLGAAHLALGDLPAAGLVLVWTIQLKRQHGNVGGAAEALADYGRVVALAGDPEAGLRYQRRAMAEARRLGDGYFESIIGNGLGETLNTLDRHEEAVAAFERSLRDGGHRMPYEAARSRAGLAAALATRDPSRAAREHATATAAFTAMGIPADVVARLCAPLPAPSSPPPHPAP